MAHAYTRKDGDEHIFTASQAVMLFRKYIRAMEGREGFFVLPLGADGVALSDPILVAVGFHHGTVRIDAGTVFREALLCGAHEIIVAHNHPSGNLNPSAADIETTIELRDLAGRLGIVFLDHLIIGTSTGPLEFLSLDEYMANPIK